MKQRLITVILNAIIVCSIVFDTAKAGLCEKATSLLNKTVKTTSFTIEAKGWNLRGCKFITPTGAR